MLSSHPDQLRSDGPGDKPILVAQTGSNCWSHRQANCCEVMRVDIKLPTNECSCDCMSLGHSASLSSQQILSKSLSTSDDLGGFETFMLGRHGDVFANLTKRHDLMHYDRLMM